MGRTRPSRSRAEGSDPRRPVPPDPAAGAASPPRPSPLEAALGVIARRPRTRAEIAAWLGRRGYSPEEISSAVERLGELGYVDDSAYTAAFAGTVARSRAWGPRRVRQELARRGVGSDAIEQGLARAAEEGASPAENLRRAVERLTRDGPPRTPRDWRRLRDALLRRGYDPEAISGALAVFGEEPSGEQGEAS